MAKDPVCGMEVNEQSALKLSWQGADYFFCSERCRQKFMAQNAIGGSGPTVGGAGETCEHCAPQKGPLWKNRILQLSVLYALVFSLGPFIKLIAPLSASLWMYIKAIALAVAAGLLLGGLIDWLVPSEYISKILAGKKKRTILYSVAAGFLMSACSHGILALSIQLYKKGASVPAVIAFLLASPWANLPITIMMFGFFGWKAFLIILSAVVIALISGYVFMLLDNASLIERNPNTVSVPEDFLIMSDVVARFKKARFGIKQTSNALKSIAEGTVSLANMVLWWIMLGMFLASLAAAYLPASFMHQFMGATAMGLLVTLIIATVMEVCSEGTAPMAFEIFRQTGALGNSFVFLMAGVVTDYTEIGLIWTNIGRRAAIWLPLVSVPQVIILGVIFNVFVR
jgi:uncharacterized membrane protein YraQ (UPF0718 family)/YHS domain-containing protein